MAGGNRTNADRLDELAEMLVSFREAFTTRMDDVSSRVESLENRSPGNPPHTPPPFPPPVPPPGDQPHRHILKLDVPRFNGADPHGWIFKITQFFAYHNTPEEERITVASFYLDGAALAWYQWMYRNGQIVSWDQFL
jgi:hypothetical protein